MEQKRQCKIDRGVVNEEDMISELPDALLLHILSSLPSETAIATSVLSKRWKSLWKMMPKLNFNSKHHRHSFSDNVCRSLVLHKSQALQSLQLNVKYECDPFELGLWIGTAFAHNVRELVLKLWLDLSLELEWDEVEVDGRERVTFPGVLCRCNNTLEILRLKGLILLDLPSPVCFNSLRELHLFHVKFVDEASVSNFLCGCPRLEVLVVHRYNYGSGETFTIALPSLQRLTIDDDFYAEGVGGYMISAPSLKYLNINNFTGLESCFIDCLPELVEAKIAGVSVITNENILESLVSAKCLCLCLSPLEIKYPTGKIFYQLLSLEMRTREKEWWNLLSLMLESSPKLQTLKLFDDLYCDWDKKGWGGVGKWKQPKCVPECLLLHLETFVWTGYEWRLEDEKEVATYILKNARQLKKAALFTKPMKSKKPQEFERRREMLNQLATEVRASNSCHLVIDSKTY